MIARNHILGPSSRNQLKQHTEKIYTFVFSFITVTCILLLDRNLPSPFIQAAVTQMMFQNRHNTNPACQRARHEKDALFTDMIDQVFCRFYVMERKHTHLRVTRMRHTAFFADGQVSHYQYHDE
jgi:hypothetical protein